MAKDIPDYMRGFDLDEDWGMTPVSSAPTTKSEPTIDKKDIENLGQQTNLEISKVKSDVGSIKAMMNEIMQIVAEKDTITKEISNADIEKRFKDIEKIVLPFLYNLGKTDSGWKENLSRIAEAHPRSALAKRYGKKSIKQIKTEQVIKKHSKRIIKNG